MLNRLMEQSYVHVDGTEESNKLYELYKELKTKGHALMYAEETKGKVIIGATLYHYKTCVVCQPDRSIP
jgi:hypothetical protein